MGNACCGDSSASAKEKTAPLNDLSANGADVDAAEQPQQKQQPADAQGDSSADPHRKESSSSPKKGKSPSSVQHMEGLKVVVPVRYKKNSAVVPKENSIVNIWDVFEQERPLGHGATSTVYLVTYKPNFKRRRPLVSDEEPDQKYALKFMNRHLSDCEKLFRHEVDIMRSLEHDGICRFFDCFEDEAGMYIVTEACLGGELFDRIAKIKFYSEDKAAKMVKKMLEIVKHMHDRDIVHRDLKPENFVFLRRSEFAPMKLIDFGVARRVTASQLYNDLVGTAFYLPPESADPRGVRTGAILKYSDMWSVGVITYVILTGCPPFYGKTTNAIFASILRGNLRFPSHVNLSDQARNFIEKLLLLNPGRRMTADQALKHPWIAGEASSEVEIQKEVIDNLKGFSQHCRLVRAFARVMRDAMSDSDRAELRENFDQLDLTRDGMLHAFELSTAMRHAGFSDREVQKELRDVMKGADLNSDGTIDRDEFEISQHPILINRSISNIRRTFKMMSEGADIIKKEDINRVFKWKLDEDDLHAMFDEIDLDGDGNISFDEFLKAMQIDAKKITGGGGRHSRRTSRNPPITIDEDVSGAANADGDDNDDDDDEEEEEEEKAVKRDALVQKRIQVNAEQERKAKEAKAAAAAAEAKAAAAEAKAAASSADSVEAPTVVEAKASDASDADSAKASTEDKAKASNANDAEAAKQPSSKLKVARASITSAVSLPVGGSSTPASEPDHPSDANADVGGKDGGTKPATTNGDAKDGDDAGEDVGLAEKPDNERVNTAATASSYERISDHEWERIQATVTSTFEPHFAQGISLAPTLRLQYSEPPLARTNSEPPKSQPTSPPEASAAAASSRNKVPVGDATV